MKIGEQEDKFAWELYITFSYGAIIIILNLGHCSYSKDVFLN